MDSLTHISLFSGYGGADLGLKLWGELTGIEVRTVCYVEVEKYCQRILQARIRDGALDDAPIWDDVRTFDGRPWAGLVDIVSGGFPCTDTSIAGKRAGLASEHSGLWYAMYDVVRACSPRFVIIEQPPGLLYTSGLTPILRGLSDAGYGGAITTLPALVVGSDQVRFRVFVCADTARVGWEWRTVFDEEASKRLELQGLGEKRFRQRAAESGIDGTAYGVAHGMDRRKIIGNGIVPQQLAAALVELFGEELTWR